MFSLSRYITIFISYICYSQILIGSNGLFLRRVPNIIVIAAAAHCLGSRNGSFALATTSRNSEAVKPSASGVSGGSTASHQDLHRAALNCPLLCQNENFAPAGVPEPKTGSSTALIVKELQSCGGPAGKPARIDYDRYISGARKLLR